MGMREDVAMMITQTYTIPGWNLFKVEKSINKLNKKAAKHNLPLLKLVKIATREIEDPNIPYERKVDLKAWKLPIPTITVVDFELTGEPVKLAGYTFIGTLDHNSIDNAV